MKSYHSIGKTIELGKEVWIFDKLDGSNIRAEWDHKKGFNQFGSRKKIIDSSTHLLSKAISLIKEKEALISKELISQKIKESTLFFEFCGNKSSFGQHEEMDDSLNIVLIDLTMNKKGLLYPPQFLEVSKNIPSAKLLFHGILTQEVVDSIVNNTMPGITEEGVIVKLNSGKPGLPNMFKIKTNLWMNKLKIYCGDDQALFELLA